MGYVKVRGVVANPLKRELRVEVEFIADTGAIYSVIPHTMAEKLKLKVTDKREFKIASGETAEYPISEAYVTVEGRGVTSLVSLGSDETPILLA